MTRTTSALFGIWLLLAVLVTVGPSPAQLTPGGGSTSARFLNTLCIQCTADNIVPFYVGPNVGTAGAGVASGLRAYFQGTAGTSDTVPTGVIAVGVDNNMDYGAYMAASQTNAGKLWSNFGFRSGGGFAAGISMSNLGRSLVGYPVANPSSNDDGSSSLQVNGSIRLATTSFVSLPACVSGIQGTMRPLTDSTTQVWGATITGSGALFVMAVCDGTAWTVMGK